MGNLTWAALRGLCRGERRSWRGWVPKQVLATLLWQWGASACEPVLYNSYISALWCLCNPVSASAALRPSQNKISWVFGAWFCLHNPRVRRYIACHQSWLLDIPVCLLVLLGCFRALWFLGDIFLAPDLQFCCLLFLKDSFRPGKEFYSAA